MDGLWVPEEQTGKCIAVVSTQTLSLTGCPTPSGFSEPGDKTLKHNLALPKYLGCADIFFHQAQLRWTGALWVGEGVCHWGRRGPQQAHALR